MVNICKYAKSCILTHLWTIRNYWNYCSSMANLSTNSNVILCNGFDMAMENALKIGVLIGRISDNSWICHGHVWLPESIFLIHWYDLGWTASPPETNLKIAMDGVTRPGFCAILKSMRPLASTFLIVLQVFISKWVGHRWLPGLPHV